jgi:hypothetical protein
MKYAPEMDRVNGLVEIAREELASLLREAARERRREAEPARVKSAASQGVLRRTWPCTDHWSDLEREYEPSFPEPLRWDYVTFLPKHFEREVRSSLNAARQLSSSPRHNFHVAPSGNSVRRTRTRRVRFF